MSAPVMPGTDKEALASLRGEVFLDDVGKNLEEQKAADKKAAEKAEAEARAKEDARLRAEAQAALPDDPRIKALSEALRISEEARQRQAAAAGAPAPTVVHEEPELTDGELNKLYQENPMAAIGKMLGKREKVLLDNVNRRLSTLAESGMATARDAAMRKYPDEFRVLGKEIEDAIPRLPNPAALNSLSSWDDFISWMRGKHLDKIIADRDERNKNKAADDAKAREANAAGGHTTSVIRAPAPTGGGALDPVAKEIARTLNMSEEEYITWQRMGG
jgi:hypothetical protein